MEHRIKRDEYLLNLITDFENNLSVGAQSYFSEKAFTAIIAYYETESMLVNALEVIDLAHTQFPYRAEYLIAKSRVLLNMNKAKKALKVIKTAKSISPFEFDILILEAKALTALKKFDEASCVLEGLKSTGSKSDQIEILLVEAKMNELSKHFSEMYNCLSEAILLDPSQMELYEELWLAVELSKNFHQCIDLHLKIIDVKPYTFMAWNNLGHAYSYIGEYEKAIDAFEYTFIINKEFESGYMDAADLCIQIKDHQKALKFLLEATELMDHDSDILLLIANCYINIHEYRKAKYYLFKAIKLEPYSDEIYFNLGLCYSHEKDWLNAIQSFHKAISLEDSIEDYYTHIGRAYYQLGSFDKAGQFLSKATTIAPEESAYWSEYAGFLIKQGQLKVALTILKEAEEFTFGADLLFCQGVVYLKLGYEKQAFNLFEEALEEDASQYKIIYNIDPELMLNENLNAMISYYSFES